jgi:hypothetical protein
MVMTYEQYYHYCQAQRRPEDYPLTRLIEWCRRLGWSHQGNCDMACDASLPADDEAKRNDDQSTAAPRARARRENADGEPEAFTGRPSESRQPDTGTQRPGKPHRTHRPAVPERRQERQPNPAKVDAAPQQPPTPVDAAPAPPKNLLDPKVPKNQIPPAALERLSKRPKTILVSRRLGDYIITK